ncbi:hypothetical protein SMICM17S_00348 [Streptomyces microflavus]
MPSLPRAMSAPKMPGRATPADREGLQTLVPAAVDAATGFLTDRAAEYKEAVDSVLAPYEKRVAQWQQEDALFAASTRSQKAKQDVNLTASRRKSMIRSLRTSGAPMLRLLGVLEPLSATPAGVTDVSAAPVAGETIA